MVDGFSPLSLAAVVVLIALNGFFVAAEFALVSVRRTRIQELADEGSRRATMVKAALDDLNQYVSTAQVGITICSLSIGLLGEPAIGRLLLYDALGATLTEVKVHRDPECPICSRAPDEIADEEMGVFPDYEAFCAAAG